MKDQSQLRIEGLDRELALALARYKRRNPELSLEELTAAINRFIEKLPERLSLGLRPNR